MRQPLFGCLRRHFGEKIHQRFQTRGSHVRELAFVKFANGGIHFFEQFEPLVGDSRFHNAPVFLLPLACDQFAIFHAVEQAGHVGIAGDHPFADGVAWQAIRARAAQDAQDVVLGRGQPVGLHQLIGLGGQGISGFQEGDEDLIFEGGGAGCFGS